MNFGRTTSNRGQLFIESRRGLALVLGVIALAAFLRFHTLGDKSLWLDEVAQAFQARGGLNEIWTAAQSPANSFLDTFIVFLASQLGAQEFILRFPMALWGVLSVAVLYRLVSEWYDRRVAWVSALLLACAPSQIIYSQELRPYSLLGLAVLLCVLSFWRAIQKPTTRGWMIFAMAQLLAVQTRIFGLMILSAEGVYLLWWVMRLPPTHARTAARELLLPFFASASVAVVSLLPFFSGYIQGASELVYPRQFHMDSFLSFIFLWGAALLPLAVVFNPFTAWWLGQLITPWQLWRLTWVLPVSLIVAYLLTRIDSARLGFKPSAGESKIVAWRPRPAFFYIGAISVIALFFGQLDLNRSFTVIAKPHALAPDVQDLK